ncbi:transglutaminase domain-containing protein [Limnovirga soli]|uniref:Transglutaminase-like domain-containing protein n=1 Tax=Limnovirga soli TaxID=2656915 RepID=A0A8J8JT83_9BACT|nr:transglutaminase domain-containing protein [Limnovirga soli]NNV55623.1 hypothetical protein [Limnovirga soli]
MGVQFFRLLTCLVFGCIGSICVTAQTNKNPLPKLAAEITAGDSTDKQKVRSIFNWVTSHIDYNVAIFNRSSRNPQRDYSMEEDDDSTAPLQPLNIRVALTVLERGTAVCDGYARLFKVLCDYTKIPCEIITGYGKTNINRTGTQFRSNHKWNAVFLDSAWHLLDATWASGYINYRNEFERAINYNYFLTQPAQFAEDHYPEEQKWMLLDSFAIMKEFNATPFKTGAFNRNYIAGFTPVNGIIETHVGDSIVVSLQNNRTKKLLWATDIANIDSSTIFILQCCGAGKPVNTIQGNTVSYTYHVTNAHMQWLNIIYNDELLMRYRIKINEGAGTIQKPNQSP